MTTQTTALVFQSISIASQIWYSTQFNTKVSNIDIQTEPKGYWSWLLSSHGAIICSLFLSQGMLSVPMTLCHQRLPSLPQTMHLFNVHASATAQPSHNCHAPTVPS